MALLPASTIFASWTKGEKFEDKVHGLAGAKRSKHVAKRDQESRAEGEQVREDEQSIVIN